MTQSMNNEIRSDADRAWEILMANKSNVRVAVQVAPAVRVAVGEAFGLVKGEDALGKLTTALRVLGADLVVDAAIAEDANVYRLAQEVKARIENGGSLPVVFSQNSQWVKDALAQDNLAPYVVAVRPAMQALAVEIKKAFLGDGKRTFVIAIVPCTCKKDALQSVGLRVGEKPAVDLALTTAEMIEILRAAELDLKYVPASPCDEPFGLPSGSGYIADIGGGVAEGVLRCFASDRSFEGIRRIEYSGVRGYKSLRVGYSDVNATVVCKDDAESVMQDVVSGNCSSAFVEVVGNPLGCVAGNGQPAAEENALRLRAYALYSMDKRTDVRVADEAEDTVALANAFAKTEGNDGFDELEVELSPFEEVVVEEVAVEEVAVEEVTVEEVVEETIAEEAVEEVVEEIAEEPAPIEEVVEVVEEVAEEPAPVETVEEVVEEVVEEPAPIEEVVEVVEEVVEEPAPVEEVVEEPEVEEEPEQEKGPKTFDPNYRRMSKKERRKMKRGRNN